MPELLATSLPTAVLFAYFLLSITSVLTALVAWQTARRLREDSLRQVTVAFTLVAAIQAVFLAEGIAGWAIPGPLLRALDCVSAAMISWAFFGRGRRLFLVSSLSMCGVVSAFAFSLWQLTGAEITWMAQVWSLSSAIMYSAAAWSLWTRRRERPLLFLTAFVLLVLGDVVRAAGWPQATVVLRLVAFPLVIIAVMQLSTRDLESVEAELVSFSEHSLRQTQQLLALLHTSTAFLVHADLPAISREAVEGVAVGVGADSALVALLDDAPDPVLRVQAVYPPTSRPNVAPIPLFSQPLIADAVQRRQQVVVAPSQRGAHALAALMGSDAGPAIVQPLLCQQHVLGVIVALNGRCQRAFTESEQRVLEAFGAQVAAAAENALLDRVIETQTRELAELLSAREEEASRRAAILESVTDGVIVFDHQGQAVVTNPAVNTILDLEANVVGRKMHEIMNSHIQPDDYALIHSRIESGQPLPPGFKIAWGSKTVALSVAPVKLTSAGRHGTVMVLHDITHDAEVDRMKSEFVTVVSHELRTPFAEIDSSMQLIQGYGLNHLAPEQREQLDQLSDELKRARTMINNLVTIAAFLSRQGQLRIASLDMGQLAREVLQALEPMARTRGVTMTPQIADALPSVYGDRDRLAEAIYHLLHNAIKFNQPGGSATLSCRAAPDGVIVEISDTGVGIPPEKLPEMWKNFTQLADPLRRGVEGLGLGLPLVRYIVREHGGQVWARSQPGQGSVFGFSIPVASHP